MSHSNDHFSRRRFLGSAAATSGLGLAGLASAQVAGPTSSPSSKLGVAEDRLPREVWIATITQDGLEARDHLEMSDKVLERLEPIRESKPDIVCLPEIFQYSNTSTGRPPLREAAESPLGAAGEPFAAFAKANNCYILYSTYTEAGGKFYNSAVLIDRQGEPQGCYHKLHPTIGELENGISPGPLDVPVFETDFGTIGAQICFDIEWDDGWQRLAEKGAEIVFWQSAFAGGSAVNAKAWRNQYVVVTSCRKDTSKICDISGEVVAATGRWNRVVCAPVNLEKVFLHTWPFNRRFDEILAKYGRKVQITNFHEEEWSIIESRHSDVKVADILKEFELESYADFIARSEQQQLKFRQSIS